MTAQLVVPHVEAGLPLVVDLDGTLIRTDLLQESTLKLVRRQPGKVLALPVWLTKGKAHLKRRISELVDVDVTTLPYVPEVVEIIERERVAGRTIVLCTASDVRYARQVADHLQLFDEIIASDGVTNMSAHRKARRLVERFGTGGFDYMGNSRDDLAVWKESRHAIVVNASKRVSAESRGLGNVSQELPVPSTSWRTWVRAMRLHQWMKNLLIFIPLAGGYHLGELDLLWHAVFAFISFGLCASSVYLLNDLMDLESDRLHPRKRLRPFASGQLAPTSGVALSAALLLLSLPFALLAHADFLWWLGIYFLLTLSYTFDLKTRPLLDCIALGLLYTIRIVAGSAAVGLPPSFWLLAFSLFLFLSLAFVKRYSELLAVMQAGRLGAHGRGYQVSDLSLVQSLGIASGFTSILLLALYINSEKVLLLYSHPERVWMTIPVMLYWVTRMWLKAQRGVMHDDPVVFAMRDRVSLACAAAFALVMFLAR